MPPRQDGIQQTPSALTSLFRGLVCVWLFCGLVAYGLVALGTALGGGLPMTASQGTFLLFGWLLVPMAGALAFAAGADGTPACQGLMAAAATALGLAAGAGLAIALYPNYPNDGPHEWLACLFAMPALLGGSAVLWRTGSGRTRVAAVATFTLVAVLLMLRSYPALVPGIDHELPLALDGVQRWGEHDQDVDLYYVVAPATAAEFGTYTQDLDLTPSAGGFECWPLLYGPTPDVWRPVQGAANTWFRDDREPMADRERYPSGKAGCVTQAVHFEGRIFACLECTWGI